jgi:single stranded DNA-binding protein
MQDNKKSFYPRTFAKAVIIGRIGSINQKQIGSSSLLELSIATDSLKKNTNEGSQTYESQTQWNRVKAFEQKADSLFRILKKGDMVYVEASIKNNQWKNEKGENQYRIDFIIKELIILSSSQANQSESSTEYYKEKNYKDKNQILMNEILDNSLEREEDEDLPFF